jgi:23S rRNA (cytidine1920-2'-O)/16S rRNA (cytidine1409-2'-O)-methyltransferase
MVRRRLDAELVRRGLARSRQHAGDLVTAGHVKIAGILAHKPATQVETGAAITVSGPDDASTKYASRGATKLLGALEVFVPRGLVVAGRRCLDAGASTGGFTDVLLRAGAQQVVAVDVGYGQLAWPLRNDPRVLVRDRTNVRDLTSRATDGPVGLVVADLSFISLRLALPALVAVTLPDADLVVMVKPQFEVGKDRLPSGGVVRDPLLRGQAVTEVADAAADLGLGARGVTASPLPGPAGNVEYFLWLHRDAAPLSAADVDRAIEEGPT